MEASALHAPSLTRVPLGAPLLRLRSDEQLLALFRAGNEDAFGAIHDRYRQRLFAYVRQMLSAGPRQDAEDVMQDVFVRAYGALRADDREVNLRAWLYRVAHNRCIDHLRRPTPPPAEIFEMSRKPLHDPIEEAQRREDLARLVEDVGRLPEQQRSALLMREIDGMSYADLAAALDVTVPAVKSLLVRARVGLVEAAEARDADCCEIRDDLMASYDRGVKASGRARRAHALVRRLPRVPRGAARHAALVRRAHPGVAPACSARSPPASASAAAVPPRAARPRAAAASPRPAAGGTLATATACKVAAVVCTAALTAGGAVEVHKLQHDRAAAPAKAAAAPAPRTRATAAKAVRGGRPAGPAPHDEPAGHGRPRRRPPRRRPRRRRRPPSWLRSPPAPRSKEPVETTPVTAPETTAPTRTGGVSAPEQAEAPAQSPGTTAPGTTAPATGTPPQSGTAAPEQGTPSGSTGSGAQNGPAATRAPRRPSTSGDNLAAIDRYLETLDHETLLVRRGRRSGLYTMVAVHSTARGPSLGGCRMWTYGDSRAAVRDVLRLSRAMTFKAAVAGLPLGGGKGVIMLPAGHAPPTGDERRDVLLDFGETVDALDGAYITAEDVGTSDRDMAVIAEATDHVAGLAVETRQLGRPEPVDRARRPVRDGGRLRARLRQRLARRAAASRSSASAASAASSPGCCTTPAPRSWWPTSTRASARSRTSSAPPGPTPTPRWPPRSTCSPRARSAACSTTTPCPSCAAA